jgi:hypothetical protein
VAERIDRGARHRYSVSGEATERALRLCAFALLDHYLAMHRVMVQHAGLQPVELLILIAATTGNVQRAVGLATLPESIRGSQPLPAGMMLPMSRRAIARITGIPTETVRRHVDSMVRRGVLVSSPRGVHAPNRLAERRTLDTVLRLLELHAGCTEHLVGLQAIVPRATRPARAMRP